MVQKTAAVVILFQPEQSVEKNISSYIKFTDKVYVYDNSEISNDALLQSLSQHQNKIAFIHDGKNEGIAKRLNQACALASQEGFDYLLTMDQDSYFDKPAIVNYFECIDAFKNKSKVSMFGVNHEKQSTDFNCLYKKTNFLITSGSIINLNAYRNIGAFDENLFIDFVDVEYCFRSVLKEYDIISFPNIFMHHKLGESLEKRSLKSLQKTKRSFHSSVRLYYMTRNFLYLNKKYKDQFAVQLNVNKKDLLNRIKNKLLYHQNRFTTIQYLFKAFQDYRNNKMGKQF